MSELRVGSERRLRRLRRRRFGHSTESASTNATQSPLRRLRAHWFGDVDLAPLGLFRIVYGALLVNYVWQLYPNLNEFFTDEGMLPRRTLLAHWTDRFSVLNLFGDWWQIALFWLASLVVAVLVMVGYRTRLSTVLALVSLMAFQWRNPLVMDGSDYVYRFIALWLIFTAAGDRYSIDAAMRRARGDPPTAPGWALPIRILEVQIGLIYLTTAIEKFPGTTWLDGTAIYYALQLDHTWAREWAVPLAQNLGIARVMTWGTLAIELSFLPLVLSPVFNRTARLLAIVGGVLLHGSIFVLMNVGNFPVIMLGTLILFAPPRAAVTIVGRVGRLFRGSRVRLFYDGHCAFCRRTVAYLGALDGFGTLSFVDFRAAEAPDIGVPASELATRIHSVDERGRVRSGFAAIASASRGVPVLLPLALISAIPLARGAAEALYDWVAARRFTLFCHGAPCALHASLAEAQRPARTPGFPRRRLKGVLLGTAAALAFMTATPPLVFGVQVPSPLREAMVFASLDQRWNMFSPDPPTTDSWLLAPARLADGTTYDLLTKRAPSGEPRYADPFFSRWTKALHVIVYSGYSDYTLEYARMFCRERNLHLRFGESPLQTFELRYVQKQIPPPPGGAPTHREYIVWSHAC